jgi:hypothetical protein
MLGWWIIVRRLGGPDLRPSVDPNVLATWETSVGGLDWLDDLEKNGKARCRSRGGYPTIFIALAEDVLPILRAGQPPRHRDFDVIGDDYFTPAGWRGPMTVHHERIAECPGDEVLRIDAWDQS